MSYKLSAVNCHTKKRSREDVDDEVGGWRDVDDELDGWRDDLDKSF